MRDTFLIAGPLARKRTSKGEDAEIFICNLLLTHWTNTKYLVGPKLMIFFPCWPFNPAVNIYFIPSHMLTIINDVEFFFHYSIYCFCNNRLLFSKKV